jgi:hypothetical protein
MRTFQLIGAIGALLCGTFAIAQTADSTNQKTKVIEGKKMRVTIKTEKLQNADGSKSQIIVDQDTMFIDDVEAMADSLADVTEKIVEEKIIINDDCADNHDKPYVKSRNNSEWFNCDFGFNFLVSNGQLDMPDPYKDLELDNGKGCNFNLRVFEQSLGIVKDRLYLVYGVGVDWNNYRFKNNIDLLPDSTPLAYKFSNEDYKKNKLVSTYVTVPLMLKVNLFTDKDGDAFEIAAGPQFGYLIDSHLKQKWDNDGKQKRKVNGDFNLNEFRIGYSLYFGYKDIDFYVRYFPDSAFKKGKGPDANTMAFGLALGVPE